MNVELPDNEKDKIYKDIQSTIEELLSLPSDVLFVLFPACDPNPKNIISLYSMKEIETKIAGYNYDIYNNLEIGDELSSDSYIGVVYGKDPFNRSIFMLLDNGTKTIPMNHLYFWKKTGINYTNIKEFKESILKKELAKAEELKRKDE